MGGLRRHRGSRALEPRRDGSLALERSRPPGRGGRPPRGRVARRRAPGSLRAALPRPRGRRASLRRGLCPRNPAPDARPARGGARPCSGDPRHRWTAESKAAARGHGDGPLDSQGQRCREGADRRRRPREDPRVAGCGRGEASAAEGPGGGRRRCAREACLRDGDGEHGVCARGRRHRRSSTASPRPRRSSWQLPPPQSSPTPGWNRRSSTSHWSSHRRHRLPAARWHARRSPTSLSLRPAQHASLLVRGSWRGSCSGRCAPSLERLPGCRLSAPSWR
mmetsp:Transcript_5577/g.17508  ORF Transcript_5577/g.17508 Transcript_5577/m.17508 type:complete len:278 (+) Transcript_5577:224-1057(+)